MLEMTPGRKKADHYARQELARRYYSVFAPAVFSDWEQTDHHKMLGQYLSQVELFVATQGERGIGRLMVFMPPRHGKSLNVSVLFPTWFLGRHPDSRVIVASYNGALAMGFSRQARNLMMDDPYREVFGDLSERSTEVRIADDSRSVEAWSIHGRQGGLVAVGVGGGITGRGAHLLIIDDPVRDRSDAESRAKRDAIWDWYASTAYTRLEKAGAVIVMHTRWHEDDLAGRLKDAMARGEGDEWVILDLPAVAGDDDQLGREAGQALWPAKYDLDALEQIKTTIGGYEWDALYQQAPRRREGAMIKAHEIPIMERVPSDLRTVRYWDLAVSGKARADYIVGARAGRAPDGRIYILDIARFPGPWADARPRMVRAMLADGPDVTQGIEVSGQQGGYFQELQRDDQLVSLPIRGINPREVGSKEVRANVWASRIEDGLVAMARAPWNDDFIAEALAFPRGKHDDQVDGVSGAVQMLSRSQIALGTRWQV